MKKWQYRLHVINFKADNPSGKLFDVLLVITLLLGTMFISLDSVEWINKIYHVLLILAGSVITILFSIKYF